MNREKEEARRAEAIGGKIAKEEVTFFLGAIAGLKKMPKFASSKR